MIPPGATPPASTDRSLPVAGWTHNSKPSLSAVSTALRTRSGTTIDDDLGGVDGYADYSIGVNRDFGPVNIALGYHGTNADAEDFFGTDNAEDKFVLTFSVGG